MPVQRWTGQEARSLRLALRMTVRGLAELVGVSPRTVSKWESRGASIEPRPELQAALDTVLNRADGDARARFLVSLGTASQHGPGGLARLGPWSDDESVRRRELLQVLAGTTVGAALAEPAEVARRRLEGSLLDAFPSRDADDWAAAVEDHAAQVGATDPGELLRQLQVDVNELAAVMQVRPHGVVHPDLTRSAAQLAAMIALCSVAVGATASAARWWRTARRLADSIADSELGTFITGQRAVMAPYSGFGGAVALRLAEEALVESEGTVGAGRATALGAKAQGFASLDRLAEAERTFRELEQLVERMPAQPSTRSWFAYSETKLRHVQSFVRSTAGGEAAAQQAQDDALALYPKEAVRGRAQIAMHRALTLVRMGSLDEGLSHAVGVLSAAGPAAARDRLVLKVAESVLDRVPQARAQATAAVELQRLVGGAAL